MNDKNIKANMQSLMKEMDFTAKALADKAGLSESGVCRILSGERTPNVRTLIKIAKALDVTVETLLA